MQPDSNKAVMAMKQYKIRPTNTINLHIITEELFSQRTGQAYDTRIEDSIVHVTIGEDAK